MRDFFLRAFGPVQSVYRRHDTVEISGAEKCIFWVKQHYRGLPLAPRGTQKVVPDHFCAAPRPYVVRIDIGPLNYAPIGTGVKKGAIWKFTSPTGPTVVPRAHFLTKSRARSVLSAHDSIEVGPARDRPDVRYQGRTPSGVAPAARFT